MNDDKFTHIKTLSQQHRTLGIASPKHPLFSIVRFENIPKIENEERFKKLSDFYQVALKIDCPCKLKYGQSQYDFDKGVLSFFAPKQVSILEPGPVFPASGWLLTIHPDFLRSYPLNTKIKTLGFFDYNVNEALLLSEEEQQSIEKIFEQIDREYRLPIDTFSQDVVIANIELLFTYCQRYYNRQFITRKIIYNDLLAKVERLLNAYFENETGKGLPTAADLASQLNMSPKYLSDCLKQLTGQTAQQLIHEKLIEHAKDILTTTDLSVSEIAYQLGFEYPQSFNKLFKQKTNQTPVEYRQSFN
ncbi:MAG: helix-turn-helix transcriptional regulator [Tannerella sp.]|jgi:AraC-like DNA-binding protein|nr:helix-turn-helix transcriptional regulator [Tannerella sp.]